MQTWLGSSFSYLLECIVLCRAIEKDSVGVHSDSLLSLVKAVEFFQLCWNPLVFQLWIIHQFVLVCDCLLGNMMDTTIAHLFNVNCMVEPSWEFNESPLNFRFITCYMLQCVGRDGSSAGGMQLQWFPSGDRWVLMSSRSSWLGKLPTCRRQVGPTAKSRHIWPTGPRRADTNSFPTHYFVSGIADFLQIFSKYQRYIRSNHRTNWYV